MVKFAHPAIGYGEVDWDAAGTTAISRVLAAGDTRTYTDAVQEMLAALRDPTTRVVADCVPGTPAAVPDSERLADGTLILRPTSSALDPATALRQSQRVIIDLRTPAGACSGPSLPDALQSLPIRTTMTTPPQWKVVHQGYKSQSGSSVYSSHTITMHAQTVEGDPAAAVERVVFVVDEQSTIPPIALALERAGRAAIASVGPLWDDRFVNHVDVPLGEGFHAVIRSSEMVPATAPATVIPATSGEAAIIGTATALLGPPSHRRAVSAPSTTVSHTWEWRADAAYATMTYPPVEYRVLAAYRLWNIVNFFYGYPQLIDPWEPRLGAMVQMMIDAKSADDYGFAIGTWMTWIPDAHSFVAAPPLGTLFGAAGPPFRLLPIGDDFIVNTVNDTASGVQRGDALTAIDGAPVADRVQALARYIVLSTPAATRYRIGLYLPRGPAGSTSSFTFRRPDGTTYDATLTRISGDDTPLPPSSTWKTLPGNIGYVDLRYLMPDDVGTALGQLKNTRGLILDMRGYPNGVFPTLAAVMNTTGATAFAQFLTPMLAGGVRGLQPFSQGVPPQTLLYGNKTVTLIDIHAISQAEHTRLTLEAVNGTTFIGTPTEGANGNVTLFVLPGNIYGQFTGMDVRHADGRQLQRIGIQPDIEVSPTPEGLREGKDEVLDRAVEFLTTGH